MYDAFPFQLVWTPLAWHAVVTGLVVFGLHSVLVSVPVWRQVLTMVLLGLGGGFFAAYWPQERAVLPPEGQSFFTIWERGLLRWRALSFGRSWGAAASGACGAAGGAGAGGAALGSAGRGRSAAERLALLPMLGLTLWAMRRLGPGDRAVAPSVPLWRHGIFLVAPLTTALIAAFAVRGTPGFAANIVAALSLGPLGLGLWLWLLWQALRRPSGAPPRAR